MPKNTKSRIAALLFTLFIVALAVVLAGDSSNDYVHSISNDYVHMHYHEGYSAGHQLSGYIGEDFGGYLSEDFDEYIGHDFCAYADEDYCEYAGDVFSEDFDGYTGEESGGHIGDTPIHIVPFSGQRTVTFNPNGGTTPDGHAYRITAVGATNLGSSGAMPNSPSFGGRGFMWWSTDPHGRDPDVQNFADIFSYTTYIPEEGLTVYAVWGFNVSFHGNSHTFPAVNPNVPTNPDSYVMRLIPNTWNFDEAQTFGLPVTFPNNPSRPGFQFWGWYNYRIPNEVITIPAPSPAVAMNRYSVITSAMEIAARWRLHTHLVMFDMNYSPSWVTDTPFLAAGTALQPQRLYRWVLDGRSIMDSGLGGDPQTGLGLPTGTMQDVTHTGAALPGRTIPQEWYRQNRVRPWTPNEPPGNAGHIPRLNPAFTTPYYPGSGLVRGTAAGVIGTDQGAGTQWPRTAPNVLMPNTWIAVPGAPNLNGQLRPRYTLEGWWTTPDGWAQNGPGNIVGRRFAPVGATSNNNHTFNQAPAQAAINVMPQGFPTGFARPVVDGQNPPTGIVTQDMRVYAQWVYRVTFHLNTPPGFGVNAVHGPQGFSLESNFVFSPHTSNIINFRDIDPNLPPSERTINQNGQRIRYNAGTFEGQTFSAHEPLFAGMPPYAPPIPPAIFPPAGSGPSMARHIFNGWWDRPIPTIPHNMPGYDYWMNSFPESQGATRITGDTQVDGNLTAFAHWRYVPTPDVYVNYHLNAPLANINTEGNHGLAYWPTHRPYEGHVSNRFFLTRNVVSGYNINITLPNITETAPRYTTQNLMIANVNYADRYSEMIRRRYGYGNAIIASAHAVNLRLPRNPRRTGYVFVGWSTDPYLPVFQANGNVTGVGTSIWDGSMSHFNNDGLIWNISTPLDTVQARVAPNGTLNLYAIWASAFDLILNGNGNDGPGALTEIVRPMPIGFTMTEIAHDSRWSSYQGAHGGIWYANTYTMTSATNPALAWRTMFSRTGFTQIGLTNAYNTDPLARVGYGTQIINTTRFNNAFFNQFEANNLQPNPNGNDYIRIYLQWGNRLTFNSNHLSFAQGVPTFTRHVDLPAGHSVEMAADQSLRHMHLMQVQDMWGDGWSSWQGTAGVAGTRGGWPRDPTQQIPPRATDSLGGDWTQLFTLPNNEGMALIGWHMNSNGICSPERSWVTATTPINGNTTVYAIWGPYIIFDPGLGEDEVNMGPVGDLRREVTIGQSLPAPHPGNPTWEGRTFVNWYPVYRLPRAPLPRPASLNTDTILMARRYYAVWSAPVYFHPSGPGSLASGGNIASYCPLGSAFRREHYIGLPINPHHDNPTRPGWPNSAFSGYWFALDSSEPNGRRIYHPSGPREVMQQLDLFGQWISTFTFLPGHPRGRLGGLTTNANIVRQVPEGLYLNTNPENQRVPAAIGALDPTWLNDPGIYFAGWRRVNAAGDYLNPDGTIADANDPLPALWTPQQVGDLVAAGPSYYFVAVWGLRLEFFKVGGTINADHPFGHNPLPGARFVLERREYVPGTGFQWLQAYPLEPLEYVESDANGRVFIDSSIRTNNEFNEYLRLNGSLPALFRLREIQAAPGYRTPPGYWLVSISPNLGAWPSFTAENHNPAFQNTTVASGPLQGRRQFVRNTPYEFDFWKVDQNGNELPNAEFRLFVFNGTTTPPPGLVTSDMIGSGVSQWTEVRIQESCTTDAMVFRMRPGRHYQLLETIPPVGFQLPIGQWRITVDTAVKPAHPTLYITRIGESVPAITPCTAPETYLIINWANLALPFTGGRGARTFVLSGAVVVFLGFSGAAVMVGHKRKSTGGL